MAKLFFSHEAYQVYASFWVDIAAGVFLTIPLSGSLLDLTWRLIFSILCLYLAILLRRRLS